MLSATGQVLRHLEPSECFMWLIVFQHRAGLVVFGWDVHWVDGEGFRQDLLTTCYLQGRVVRIPETKVRGPGVGRGA
jgi:hypothetical protein